MIGPLRSDTITAEMLKASNVTRCGIWHTIWRLDHLNNSPVSLKRKDMGVRTTELSHYVNKLYTLQNILHANNILIYIINVHFRYDLV